MGNGERDNAKRDELHRIEQDLTPEEWASWVWHGIRRLEERLAAEAQMDQVDEDKRVD